MRHARLNGAGLGLRRALLEETVAGSAEIDFLEFAPENWLRIGGRLGRQFRDLAGRFPLVCHGLSLSLGGPDPLDFALLGELKAFLTENRVVVYSEHLSASSDHGHLYDLMPIPFTPDAARYTAERIRRVQDYLGQRIAIENVSYYAAPGQAMDEIDFINRVLTEADCDLLLDVNNIYVNSVNHGYDAEQFLDGIPGERIAYLHIAGHYQQADDLIIDTHGAAVIDPVWALLQSSYRRFGALPTLLERDFNFPPMSELIGELDRIRAAQADQKAPQRRYA